jgi:hypothetical protein
MHHVLFACIALVALLTSATASAQVAEADTFFVTLTLKTPAHPWYGVGRNDSGYSVNGVEGKELTLVRGQAYVFQMVNIPWAHGVYLTTSARGEGESPWSQGVKGESAYGNRVMTFTPPPATPDILYYQSVLDIYMGGKINIVDSLTSLVTSEGDIGRFRGQVIAATYPNPCNGAVTVRLRAAVSGDVVVTFVDPIGREFLRRAETLVAEVEHRVVVSTAELPTGLYHYTVAGHEGAARTSGTIRVVH